MERILKGIAGALMLLVALIAILVGFLSLPKKKTVEKPEELLTQYLWGTYYVTEGSGFRQVEDETMGVCLIRPGDQAGFPTEISFHLMEQLERPVFILDEGGVVIWEQSIGGGTHRIRIPREAEVISLALRAGEAEQLQLAGYGVSAAAETSCSGKRLSVLGDSISAYENYIPKDYRAFYSQSHFKVQSMWWMKVAEETGMSIGRINACGGSGFTVPKEEAGGGPLYADSSRCEDLSGINGDPDVILILLGANDFDQGVGLQEIGEHYEAVIQRIRKKYSKAELYLCTYYGFTVMTPEETEMLNGMIRETAEKTGLSLIDSAECGILPGGSQTLDGVHPNEKGQALLGDYIAKELIKEKEQQIETKTYEK